MFKLTRRPILVAIAGIILVLGLAGAVWAATAAKTPVTLNEAQRNEVVSLRQQMLEIQKKIIGKQVEYGLLTPAEGKAREAQLDVKAERLENWDGTCPANGFGGQGGRLRARGGRFMMRRFGAGNGPASWTCPNCGAVNKTPSQ